MASGNTDMLDPCHPYLPDFMCQVSEAHHLCSSPWTALCRSLGHGPLTVSRPCIYISVSFEGACLEGIIGQKV